MADQYGSQLVNPDDPSQVNERSTPEYLRNQFLNYVAPYRILAPARPGMPIPGTERKLDLMNLIDAIGTMALGIQPKTPIAAEAARAISAAGRIAGPSEQAALLRQAAENSSRAVSLARESVLQAPVRTKVATPPLPEFLGMGGGQRANPVVMTFTRRKGEPLIEPSLLQDYLKVHFPQMRARVSRLSDPLPQRQVFRIQFEQNGRNVSAPEGLLEALQGGTVRSLPEKASK